MALYISAGRRFRRTLVIAVAAAVVAFAIGWLIGHQQVPSIAERVTEVQQDGESQATGLERLSIEYEQVLAGTDDLDSSVLQPLDDLRTELQSTMDRAPWLTSAQRGSDARRGVPGPSERSRRCAARVIHGVGNRGGNADTPRARRLAPSAQRSVVRCEQVVDDRRDLGFVEAELRHGRGRSTADPRR